MNNNNAIVKGLSNLASNGIDFLFEAASNELKKRAGLPNRGSFHAIVAEFIDENGLSALWNQAETLAIMTITSAGRRWKVIACDQGDIVCIVLPTVLQFPPNQVPGNLACRLLSRTVKIPFGGYDLCESEGSLVVRCQASIPADSLTGDLLGSLINILIADVADLYDQLDR